MRTKITLLMCVVFALFLVVPAFGAGQGEGVTEDEIKIGSTQALSGPVASIGRPMAEGMEAFFDHVNKEGYKDSEVGINGRKVNLNIADDQFDPSNTTTYTRRMVERDGVFAIVGSLGSPNVLAVMDYLNEAKIPFVYQGGGASELAIPPKEYVFPFQPNYLLEGNLMVQYMADELDHTRLGVIYRDSEDGNDAFESMEETVAMYDDVEIVEDISVSEGASDFSTAIGRLEDADVDGVMCTIFNPQTSQYIEQAKDFGFLGEATHLLTYANSDPSVIEGIGADTMEGVQAMAWVLADFDDEEFEPWQWYADYVGEEDAVPNAYGVAGMVAAELFTEAAYRAGKELTREALVDELENMDNWDGKLALGVTYDEYDSEDVTCRLGKQSMYVMEVQDGEWHPVTEWIEYEQPE